jgi:hypothetical protein
MADLPDDSARRRGAPAPEIEIVAVSSTEMGTLRNVFQFYEYDFIQAGGDLAGFALVNRKASRVVDGEAVWWMGPSPSSTVLDTLTCSVGRSVDGLVGCSRHGWRARRPPRRPAVHAGAWS